MLADRALAGAGDQLRRQWLYLRNLDVDHARTCGCSRTSTTTCARRSAQETELFFESILREDRSVLDLLQRRTTRSSTSGWPSTTASRTSTAAASAASTLDADSRRGGLLRQGSILTVTSYATRTSPVIRGKWILENLLGVPPPPPPPDVPALKDNTVDGNLSVRERLAEHRATPPAPAAIT